MTRCLIALLPVLMVAGCRSAGAPADRIVYALNHDVEIRADGRIAPDVAPNASADAPPSSELTEAQRRIWFDERREARRDIPIADNGPHPAPRPRTRTIYVHDRPSHAAWAIPLTLGIGYGLYRWKRHGDRHHGHRYHGHHSSRWVGWWGGSHYGFRYGW